MAKELLPEVRSILEGSTEEFSVPKLMSKEAAEEHAALPEVKTNVPKEKFRIQSSRKSKA